METKGSEGMSQMDIENARALIQDRIGYSVLPDYGFSQDLLDEIVELLAEVVAILLCLLFKKRTIQGISREMEQRPAGAAIPSPAGPVLE